MMQAAQSDPSSFAKGFEAHSRRAPTELLKARCVWEVHYVYYFLKDFQEIFGVSQTLPAVEVFEDKIDHNDDTTFEFVIKAILGVRDSRHSYSGHENWQSTLKTVLSQTRSPYWVSSPFEQRLQFVSAHLLDDSVSNLSSKLPEVTQLQTNSALTSEERENGRHGHSGSGAAQSLVQNVPSAKRNASDANLNEHTQSKRAKVSEGSDRKLAVDDDLHLSELPLLVKIRILASLVEWATTNDKSLLAEVSRRPHLPRRPVGVDKWGNAFWYFDDHRLYCESPARFNGPMHTVDRSGVAEWSVVACSRADWHGVVDRLGISRNKSDKLLLESLSAIATRPFSVSASTSSVTSTATADASRSHLKAVDSDPLIHLAALAHASSSIPPSSEAKRRVGRPPKSSRPIETLVTQPIKKVEDAPIELSPSGRPLRQRQKSKFSDDFIEGDFSQALHDESGSSNSKNRRRRRSPQQNNSSAQKSTQGRLRAGHPDGDPNGPHNSLETLHDIRQLYSSPVMTFPAEYQQMLLQQMGYHQFPFFGMQYPPQQMASLPHMYGSGLISPFPHNLGSQFYLSGSPDPAMLARQGLVSSDMAALALAQFQVPSMTQYSANPMTLPTRLVASEDKIESARTQAPDFVHPLKSQTGNESLASPETPIPIVPSDQPGPDPAESAGSV